VWSSRRRQRLTIRAKCEVLEAKCEALETGLLGVKTLLDLRDTTLDLFVNVQRSAILNYESKIRGNPLEESFKF
jgi:hypothetical protein